LTARKDPALHEQAHVVLFGAELAAQPVSCRQLPGEDVGLVLHQSAHEDCVIVCYLDRTGECYVLSTAVIFRMVPAILLLEYFHTLISSTPHCRS